jgi:hypothetical protein
MRDQYPDNRGVRPQEVGSCEQRGCGSARLFVCVECRGQALICSKCDRGQIYCAGDCALRARRRRQRAAGARYQASRRGRFTHAERARRYRARRKNVTHQGSPPPPPDGQVHPGSTPSANDVAAADDRPPRVGSHCHWCARRCLDLLRRQFLRRRDRHRERRNRTSSPRTPPW